MNAEQVEREDKNGVAVLWMMNVYKQTVRRETKSPSENVRSNVRRSEILLMKMFQKIAPRSVTEKIAL